MVTLFFALNSVIPENKSGFAECLTVNINHTLVVNCQKLKTNITKNYHQMSLNWQ
jgi:hypothetical protein